MEGRAGEVYAGIGEFGDSSMLGGMVAGSETDLFQSEIVDPVSDFEDKVATGWPVRRPDRLVGAVRDVLEEVAG
jgi:hypothetical protein